MHTQRTNTLSTSRLLLDRLPAPARGMGAERKQLSAKKALSFMFSSVPADVSQRRPMKSKARQPLQSVVKCCTEGLQWPVPAKIQTWHLARIRWPLRRRTGLGKETIEGFGDRLAEWLRWTKPWKIPENG